jgi:hypothetical protein
LNFSSAWEFHFESRFRPTQKRNCLQAPSSSPFGIQGPRRNWTSTRAFTRGKYAEQRIDIDRHYNVRHVNSLFSPRLARVLRQRLRARNYTAVAVQVNHYRARFAASRCFENESRQCFALSSNINCVLPFIWATRRRNRKILKFCTRETSPLYVQLLNRRFELGRT